MLKECGSSLHQMHVVSRGLLYKNTSTYSGSWPSRLVRGGSHRAHQLLAKPCRYNQDWYHIYIYIYMFWQSVKQEEKETPSGLAYCQCVAEHKIVSSGRSAAKIDVRDDTMTELMFLSKSTTLRSSYTCRHSGHRLFPSMYGHNWCVQLSGFYSAAAFSLLPLMNEHGAALVWYCH